MSPYEIPDVFFRRPAWHAQAACRGMGTAMFFPGRTDDLDDARAVCARCNVKADCLAAALEDPTRERVSGLSVLTYGPPLTPRALGSLDLRPVGVASLSLANWTAQRVIPGPTLEFRRDIERPIERYQPVRVTHTEDLSAGRRVLYDVVVQQDRRLAGNRLARCPLNLRPGADCVNHRCQSRAVTRP
jgi:hypothetical protein